MSINNDILKKDYCPQFVEKTVILSISYELGVPAEVQAERHPWNLSPASTGVGKRTLEEI
jgi:hypothetical protein